MKNIEPHKELENNALYQITTLALANIKKWRNGGRWSRIHIEGYNVCNIKCKMCPYTLMTRNKEQMGMKLFKKIVDDAIKFGIETLNLNLYNEPLLDDLLFEKISYAKEKGMVVGFYSNATLLNDEKITHILDLGVDYISFSFDGYTKETYEMIRKGAVFDKTKKNITRLIEEKNRRNLNKPYVSVMLTAQKDNYSEIKNFENYWKSIADHAAACEVDNRKKENRTKKEKVLSYPCHLLCCEGIVVMSNGKIPLCCRDYDGTILLGDLKTQTVEEVWDYSNKFRELHYMGKGDQIESCKNCDALYSGYGWWLDIPSRIPFLNKIVTKLLRIKRN